MRRPLRTLAVATAVAVAVSGATATAAGGPVSVAPRDGKTLEAGKPFTFKVRSTRPGAVFVTVSKTKKKNKDGTLSRADDLFYRQMIKKSKTVYTKKTETFDALEDYFLNKPGRYYWQAYRIDCSRSIKDCSIEGPIRSFRIK